MSKKIIDMTGQVTKGWKVLRKGLPKTKNTSKSIWWDCECVKCGQKKTFNGTELRLNRVGQCKCPNLTEKQKIKKLFNSIVDETGNKYGKLTVLSFAYTKDGFAYWNCICDCGTKKIIKGNHLRNGDIKSCGCINSWKEEQIKKILEENNIIFKREYSFQDLKDINMLRFDFAIFNDTNTLKGLIEYNGEQHYEKKEFFNHNGLLQIHDKMKIEYCKNKNIPLLILNKNNINLSKDILDWIQSI